MWQPFVLMLPALAGAAAPPSDTFPAKALRPFLETHCVGCHDASHKSGGLDLEKLLASPNNFAAWVKVHDRVRSGEMPPAKKRRPPHKDAKAMLGTLSDALTAIQRNERAGNGRTTIRRMNRTEYENTLRDLLGLPALNVKELLPDDGRAYGFDRSAAALDVSPILLAKYGEAADAALDQAIAPWEKAPAAQKVRMYANHQYDFMVVIPNGDGVMLKDLKYDDSYYPIPKDSYAGGKYKDLGELHRSGAFKKGGSAGLFRRLGESFAGRFSSYSPVIPGRYRVSTSVWAFWWEKGKVEPAPRSGGAGIYYGSRLLGFLDAPSLKPTTHAMDVYLEPGEYLKFDPASLWEVHVYHRKDKAAGFTGPAVAIDYLEVEGPVYDQWPPPSHKRLFGDLPLVRFDKLAAKAPRPKRVLPRQTTRDAQNNLGPVIDATVDCSDPAAAERLLNDFLPRAFRRPVPKDEADRYTALALERLKAGDCFEDAMRSAYKAVLCSPDFLFLREPVGPLDDFSLASRLSYFLWNSMPDESLTAAAAAGKLRDAKLLRAQVDQMLADPKADRFVADFLDQWLDLREFDLTTPDRTLYPEYTPYLGGAIREEPRAFFRELLGKDLPASSVVRSDFAMLNQRLAEHYGIAGVSGTAFRRVPQPADTHRGGFLTQAAVLKVTANGTTTSPVKRGAWVMRKILGRPPEPPPPDIPAVEPDVRGTTTIREQLAKHRADASCAACHAKMDPPGFALESFDVIGGFRQRYRATQGKEGPDLAALYPSHTNPAKKFPGDIYHVGFRLGLPVDATGETVGGKAFGGIDDFRKILGADERALARNFAEQLIVYSTGAPIGFADRAEVEGILDRSGKTFGVRAMLHEVVQSRLFREK